MRFDDTNPAKEDIEYVESIKEDVTWLMSPSGAETEAPWDGPVRHTSDYFELIYDAALYLVNQVDYISFDVPWHSSGHP